MFIEVHRAGEGEQGEMLLNTRHIIFLHPSYDGCEIVTVDSRYLVVRETYQRMKQLLTAPNFVELDLEDNL